MTTISEHLEALKNDLRDCKKAVAYRGGTISTTAGFKDVANKIVTLPANNVVGTVIDDSVALKKSVPAKSTKYCFVNNIGGATYKVTDTFVATVTEVFEGTGLIAKAAFEYIPSIPFQLSQPSEDAGWTFRALLDARPLGLDRDYWLQGSQIYLNDDTTPVDAWSIPTDVVIRKISGYLDDNLAELFNVPIGTQIVCTPLFVDWDTVAYFDLPAPLRDTKVTAIKSHGSNLLDIEAALKYWGATYTKDGDTYTITNIGFGFSKPYVFTDEQSICTASVSDKFASGIVSARMDLGYYDGTKFTASGSLNINTGATTTSAIAVNAIRLNYSSITDANNWSFGFTEIRINKGTTDCGFYPYREPIIYELPQALIEAQTGKGVDGYSDIVDLENGKVITKMKTLKLGDVDMHQIMNAGGTENRYISDTGYVGAQYTAINDFLLDFELNPVICNFLPKKSEWQVAYMGVRLVPMTSTGAHYLTISIPYNWAGIEKTDTYGVISNKVRNWVAESGITVTYALEVPIESELDTDFVPLIEVEPGGEIEFVTENGYATSSTITFQTIN